MEKNKLAALYLVMTAVLWSTGGFMIKWIDWNPIAVAGVRSLIAAAVMWVVFRKEKLTYSKALWGGAIAECATVILFVTATKLTTAANAILLQYTAPLYVAIFGAWLLNERTTRRDWFTLFLVCVGMVFFFGDKVSSGGMTGNLCAIASGMSFGFLYIFTRMQKDASPHGSILVGNVITFLFSIPFLGDVALTPANIGAILFLGIFQLGFAYILYSYAISHVKALDAILITTIEPILNPIWVFLLIGEVPGAYALMGGAIVLGAILLRGYLAKEQYA